MNECPNIFVKERLMRTNVRINVRDQYIWIFEYSNIFVTLCSKTEAASFVWFVVPAKELGAKLFVLWVLIRNNFASHLATSKGHCHHVNHWKSYDDHINRSTQGHWHHTTHRIFPQTPESWQFGNCGPLVECHVLHVGNSTIVMAAHARSWGAIDPALRPPPSSVPQRTMAGAFYPQFFPKQPQPPSTQ